MNKTKSERTIEAAKIISEFLSQSNIPHAVIGAMAMAFRGYVRSTVDFDFATATDPFKNLKEVEIHLQSLGFETELITPDADDPIGGVLNIERDDIELIQIVNFLNPLAPRKYNLGMDAIAAATKTDGSNLVVADVKYLIVMKLYAGSYKDQTDAMALLEANPETDINALKNIAAKFHLEKELEAILEN